MIVLHRSFKDAHYAVFYHQVMVGRRNDDASRGDRRAVDRVRREERAAARQQVRQCGDARCGYVGGYEDGRGKIRRQFGDDPLQRLERARRATENHGRKTVASFFHVKGFIPDL
jgi:hypothetical protein